MQTLQTELAILLATHADDHVKNLAAMVLDYAREAGEELALGMLETLSTSIDAYFAHQLRLRPIAVGAASGQCLGEKEPPVVHPEGIHWVAVVGGKRGSKSTNAVKSGSATKRAAIDPQASIWTIPGAPGWWRVPQQVGVDEG